MVNIVLSYGVSCLRLKGIQARSLLSCLGKQCRQTLFTFVYNSTKCKSKQYLEITSVPSGNIGRNQYKALSRSNGIGKIVILPTLYVILRMDNIMYSFYKFDTYTTFDRNQHFSHVNEKRKVTYLALIVSCLEDLCAADIVTLDSGMF